MKIYDFLKDEMKRLNRMNDKLEEKEPEQIVNNVKAMCEIANTLCNISTNSSINL